MTGVALQNRGANKSVQFLYVTRFFTGPGNRFGKHLAIEHECEKKKMCNAEVMEQTHIIEVQDTEAVIVQS